jgi:hypothetical protein
VENWKCVVASDNVGLDLLTALLLEIRVFWDVILLLLLGGCLLIVQVIELLSLWDPLGLHDPQD